MGARNPNAPARLRTSPKVGVWSVRVVSRTGDADLEGVAVAAAVVMRNLVGMGGGGTRRGGAVCATPRPGCTPLVEHANRTVTDHRGAFIVAMAWG